MKRGVITEYLLVVGLTGLILLGGCTDSGDSVTEKAMVASEESAPQDIYNMLEDYPALEAFFTYGDLTRPTFEEKLFCELLGDKDNANTLVAMLDGLPPLFEPRDSVPEGIFEEAVEAEMSKKGPIPDMMSALATLTGNILALPEDQKEPIYDYLDRLDEMENSPSESMETLDYIREILFNAVKYLSTIDKDSVNSYMDVTIKELREMRASKDGNLDFADIDEKMADIVIEAPDGLAKILQGGKSLFYDEDTKDTIAEALYSLGCFFDDPNVYPMAKDLLVNVNDRYDNDTLGGIVDRIWTKGPVVGPKIEEMGILGYGKDGKQPWNLRELLMNATVMNSVIETISAFDREGYFMDGIDSQIVEYINRDMFLQSRDGEGEFGGGEFYQPADDFSYDNFSGLRGVIRYTTRWNIPITLTSNILYEQENGEKTKDFIRSFIPTADSITITSSLWADIYEKGEGHLLGHGRPVTEKRGYGIMVDGVYVAPLCPAVLTGADMALFLVADSVYNGPYDNIYDNMRWLLYERNFYATIDLVQFVERIPSIKNLARPIFKLLGIKMFPITFMYTKGAFPVIYSELGTVIENLPNAISRGSSDAELPAWLTDLLVNLMLKIIPIGYPAEGTDKVYLLPQDLRDMWTIVGSLGYYDPGAFHADRFLDLDHPENYMMYYDVSQHTYETDYDKINPIFPLIASLCVAMYKPYEEVVSEYPLSLDAVEQRQAAAREAFGVIYPFGYILNLLSPLAEVSLETPTYANDDRQMPLVRHLEPLLALDPSGAIDSIMELICILGRPDMEDTREKIVDGLAHVTGTIEKDSSSPYTLASEFLETPQKAYNDPRYWDHLELNIDTGAALLSGYSPHQVVETIVSMTDHLSSVDIPDKDWARATQGITQLVGMSAEDMLLTRNLIDMTDILHHINTTQTWGDALELMQDTLEPDGVLSYVLLGMERDPEYSWDQILSDTNRFLRSDTMMKCDEGSFWRDIFYLVRFMADATE